MSKKDFQKEEEKKQFKKKLKHVKMNPYKREKSWKNQ